MLGAFLLTLLTFGYSCNQPTPSVDDSHPAPLPAYITEAPTPDPDSALAAILAGRKGDSLFTPSDTLRLIARTIRGTASWLDVDPTVVARLVWIESRANSQAVGPPITVSLQGQRIRTRAVGLGQVVPEIWLGVYPGCGTDLLDIRTNICYTSKIYRFYTDLHPNDQARALLAYNGCKRGWSCDWYADAILEY